MSENTTYEKVMSNFIDKLIEEKEIVFDTKSFDKVETKHRQRGSELEKKGIFDPNLFKK